MLKIKRHKLQVLHFRKIKFASIKEVQTCVKWYSRNSLKEIKNITLPRFWIFLLGLPKFPENHWGKRQQIGTIEMK